MTGRFCLPMDVLWGGWLETFFWGKPFFEPPTFGIIFLGGSNQSFHHDKFPGLFWGGWVENPKVDNVSCPYCKGNGSLLEGPVLQKFPFSTGEMVLL